MLKTSIGDCINNGTSAAECCPAAERQGLLIPVTAWINLKNSCDDEEEPKRKSFTLHKFIYLKYYKMQTNPQRQETGQQLPGVRLTHGWVTNGHKKIWGMKMLS